MEEVPPRKQDPTPKQERFKLVKDRDYAQDPN
jgi:hypothetical protein